MSEPCVKIESLSKSFAPSSFALQKISAEIHKGQRVGIVGPDGSGKTTLLRLLAALLFPTEGSISILGLDTRREKEKIHDLCGYMPQKFGLYEELSVLQNLSLYADLKQLSLEEKKASFEKLFQFTRLAPFKDRLAGALSGGMKQKLALACSLLKSPPLLFLDEPSVGIDPISRRELWEMVSSLVKENITIFWSTAYLDEAEKCDQVLLLNEGKLLYQGPPKTFSRRTEGRVFTMTSANGSRQKKLFEVLACPDVVDATIQGKEIRIVLKEHTKPPFYAELQQTPPRFEDAFIDLLLEKRSRFQKITLGERRENFSQETSVIAENLNKQFGSFQAVHDISFQVGRGEIFGLLGPNGSGKTTTFKMLCGLSHPSSGSARVNGEDLETASSEAKQKIGYMAQLFSLYGTLSVQQNLSFFAGAYQLFHEKRKKAIEQMVDIFSFQRYLDTSSKDLPLGFQKRLSLACANMHSPSILFLDEPTSGVDPITRREFWIHIHSLVEKGVSVLVTTHFMDEAEHCDRIALIYQGKIICIDTPDALKQKAKTTSLEDAFIQIIQERRSL